MASAALMMALDPVADAAAEGGALRAAKGAALAAALPLPAGHTPKEGSPTPPSSANSLEGLVDLQPIEDKPFLMVPVPAPHAAYGGVSRGASALGMYVTGTLGSGASDAPVLVGDSDSADAFAGLGPVDGLVRTGGCFGSGSFGFGMPPLPVACDQPPPSLFQAAWAAHGGAAMLGATSPSPGGGTGGLYGAEDEANSASAGRKKRAAGTLDPAGSASQRQLAYALGQAAGLNDGFALPPPMLAAALQAAHAVTAQAVEAATAANSKLTPAPEGPPVLLPPRQRQGAPAEGFAPGAAKKARKRKASDEDEDEDYVPGRRSSSARKTSRPRAAARRCMEPDEDYDAATDDRTFKSRFFTSEDDAQVRALVANHGEGSWVAIAEEMPGKHPKQIHARWRDYLRPGIKGGPWSEVELGQLAALHKKHGNDWSFLTTVIDGRSANSIKNRVNAARRLVKKWSTAEGAGVEGRRWAHLWKEVKK